MNSNKPGSFPKGVAQPAIRALASIGVHNLEAVARHSRTELKALHGMGPKALRILEEALAARGLKLED